MHYPSAELVAVAWAKTVGGDVDPLKVATTLPADHTAWASTGFVQTTVMQSNPDRHVPLLNPVVTFDCWAAAANSNRAPWGQAGALASAIEWATYRAAQPEVEMPTDFHPARILSAFVVNGPRRVPQDEAGFARVQVDVQFAWTVTAEVTA